MVDRLPTLPPGPDPIPAGAACQQVGRLVCTDICYALYRSDGDPIWLEMDRIPLHLIEQQVTVEGHLYGRNLISVRSIGPA